MIHQTQVIEITSCVVNFQQVDYKFSRVTVHCRMNTGSLFCIFVLLFLICFVFGPIPFERRNKRKDKDKDKDKDPNEEI